MKIFRLLIILFLLMLIQVGCSSIEGSRSKSSLLDMNATKSIKNRAIDNNELLSIEAKDDSTKIQRRSIEEFKLPDFKKLEKPKELPPPKPPMDLKKVAKVQSPVLINAEAMPLSDFIIYALGEVLKITFFIDEPVKNMKTPVTLRMNQEMSPDSVLEIVVGFLEKYDLIVEEKNGALYIVKTKPQTFRPVDVRLGRDVPDSSADIVQIVFFKHAKAQELDGIIKDMVKSGINTRVYFRENALMITGPASGVKEAINIINLFDVPYMNQKKLIMLTFTYWQVDDFVKQISAILQGLGFAITNLPRDAGIYFIPVKALNSLLVIAPDEDTVKYILEWHKRLDTPEAAGTEEKAFTYMPKYSKASDLVDSLKRLYISQEAIKSSPTPSMTPLGVPQVTQPTPTPTTTAKTSSAFSVTGLKIAADDKRNMILISTSPAQYKTILSFLESLDAPPRQVLLEATIAELTLKDDLKYGLEWYIKSRMDIDKYKGDYVVSTLGKLGVGTGTGIAYQFLSDMKNIQAVINAFAQDNRINILSSPRLLVLDNQEASIQIGTDVPIITGETKTTPAETGNTIVSQSVQYRSTGLIVRIKPNINTEGMLSLEISLESSEAQQNKVSDVNSPMILTRNIKTNVVAETQQTIVLGGIMSENISDTYTKVPLVGDIPIIGNLFKSTSISKTKTELIIMITPIILTTTDETARLSDEIRKSFKWFIK